MSLSEPHTSEPFTMYKKNMEINVLPPNMVGVINHPTINYAIDF